MRPKLLYKNSLAVAAMALAFLLAANSAFAQGTSFTYCSTAPAAARRSDRRKHSTPSR